MCSPRQTSLRDPRERTLRSRLRHIQPTTTHNISVVVWFCTTVHGRKELAPAVHVNHVSEQNDTGSIEARQNIDSHLRKRGHQLWTTLHFPTKYQTTSKHKSPPLQAGRAATAGRVQSYHTHRNTKGRWQQVTALSPRTVPHYITTREQSTWSHR